MFYLTPVHRPFDLIYVFPASGDHPFVVLPAFVRPERPSSSSPFLKGEFAIGRSFGRTAIRSILSERPEHQRAEPPAPWCARACSAGPWCRELGISVPSCTSKSSYRLSPDLPRVYTHHHTLAERQFLRFEELLKVFDQTPRFVTWCRCVSSGPGSRAPLTYACLPSYSRRSAAGSGVPIEGQNSTTQFDLFDFRSALQSGDWTVSVFRGAVFQERHHPSIHMDAPRVASSRFGTEARSFNVSCVCFHRHCNDRSECSCRVSLLILFQVPLDLSPEEKFSRSAR